MTNIQTLFRKYGNPKLAIDYLKARDLAKDEMVYQGGWSSLVDEDKDTIIAFFLDDPAMTREQNDGSKVMYLMGKGYSQAQAIGELGMAYSRHNVKEIEACHKRANSVAIRVVLLTYLQIIDAADFTRVTKDLIALYTTRGIKGVNDGTSGEGLFDFIEGTVGTGYETAALRDQGYSLKVGTFSELETKFMDILRNGNYTK